MNMNKPLIFFLVVVACTRADLPGQFKVSCDNFQLEKFIDLVSSDRPLGDFKVKFNISTLGHREPLRIGSEDFGETLAKSLFDPTKKTYITIHGFKSDSTKSWMRNLRDAILGTGAFNIISVDWSEGCKSWNYVEAAKNTVHAAEQIHEFLLSLKSEVERLNEQNNRDETWMNLYLAGHSLGAHVAAQLSTLIKRDNLKNDQEDAKEPWKHPRKAGEYHIDKITGMDPAGPCFGHNSKPVRLDKGDADYVEVIHTQHSDFFALGSYHMLGHVDFYMNGGEDQPGCQAPSKKISFKDWNGRRCSHSLAYKYFIESFENYKNEDCVFNGYPWDGFNGMALGILDQVANTGWGCKTCVKMGYLGADVVRGHESHGRFLVITSSKEPYCVYKEEAGDYRIIRNILEKLPENPAKPGIYRYESIEGP